MSVESIIAELGRLTPKERSTIKGACNYLGCADEGGTLDGDIALDTLVRVLIAEGLERPTVNRLKKSNQYKSFCEKVEDLKAFFKPPTSTHFVSYLSLGFPLLVRNLQRMGLAATSRTMMAHAHRIPAVINQAFPGYAENGMLSMILDCHVENGHARDERSHQSVPKIRRAAAR